jgi:hypothetical protein
MSLQYATKLLLFPYNGTSKSYHGHYLEYVRRYQEKALD